MVLRSKPANSTEREVILTARAEWIASGGFSVARREAVQQHEFRKGRGAIAMPRVPCRQQAT